MNNDVLNATHLDITSTYSNLINLIKQVATGKPLILQQNGEQVVALISIEDLHLLERLIEAEKERIDVADAQKILAQTKEEDWIPLAQMKAELGL